jgi:dTDP-4-dehydrorhamnose reductase
MDIGDPASVRTALDRHRPWAVINAAGYVRVADAEREREACFKVNAAGAEIVARAASRLGLPMVNFSSDRVFDGRLGRAYVETDALCPTCTYGESKAEAERRVTEVHPDALIIRSSAFFGPWDQHNFVFGVLRDIAAGRSVALEEPDTVVSPTYVPDLVHATLDLLVDDERGVWHLSNRDETSWSELAERVAAEAGLSWRPRLRLVGGGGRNTALSSERSRMMPSLESAISRYFAESEVDWTNIRFLDAAE